MEAAIKREQSHAMHELCRALAGSMGNIRKHQNIKEKGISLRNGRDCFFYLQLNSSTLRSSR